MDGVGPDRLPGGGSPMSASTRKRVSPGTNYKEGKLFQFRGGEGRGTIQVVRAWPPAAWFAECGDQGRSPWRHNRPRLSYSHMASEARLGHRETEAGGSESQDRLTAGEAGESTANKSRQRTLPFEGCPLVDGEAEFHWRQRRARVYRDFLAQIPADPLAWAKRLPSRQFSGLSTIARVPGSAPADLILSNLGCFMATANLWVFLPDPPKWCMRTVRRLLTTKRQHEILGFLGFPATRSCSRIVSRVVPAAMGGFRGITRLLYLRAALREEHPVVPHLRRIGASVLSLLQPSFAPVVTPRFLLDVSEVREGDAVPHAARLLRDTLRMGELLEEAPTTIRSLDHLFARHRYFIEEMRPERLAARGTLDTPFPPPPIDGTARIRPCRTPRELIKLGRDGKNCVGSKLLQCAESKSFVYRVEVPSGRPATLELRPHPKEGRWVLAELKAARNARPSRTVQALVKAWMADADSAPVVAIL